MRFQAEGNSLKIKNMTPEETWDSSKCPSCGKNEAQESHPCPYQADVNKDSEFECYCCEDCEQNCADDI